jgi:hypothetical protein
MKISPHATQPVFGGHFRLEVEVNANNPDNAFNFVNLVSQDLFEAVKPEAHAKFPKSLSMVLIDREIPEKPMFHNRSAQLDVLCLDELDAKVQEVLSKANQRLAKAPVKPFRVQNLVRSLKTEEAIKSAWETIMSHLEAAASENRLKLAGYRRVGPEQQTNQTRTPLRFNRPEA